MSSNDVWYAVQRKLSLQNWDLHRPYTASLAVRTEGFTEEWGDPTSSQSSSGSSGVTNHTNLDWLQWEQEQIQELIRANQSHPGSSSVLRLVQYRPAWLEQLVLRVAKLPHAVLNSTYAVSELTGPLPYLQDGSAAKLQTTGQHPVQVGRQHAANATAADNAILDYLKEYRGIDLDHDLGDSQKQQSVLFTSLIRDTLAPCLTILRYQADPAAWEQIYRPQCFAAAATGSGSLYHWWQPLATWQVWSERIHALSTLAPSQRSSTTTMITSTTATARRAYAVLEHQLQRQQQKQTTNTKYYLLGTATPAVVDCLLWDHLMQALTDIHLVVVLADFPALLHYTERVWDAYHFGAAVDDNTTTTVQSSLSVWNLEENACNAFNEIPLLPTARVRNENESHFRHAVDLMKQLSVVPHDLHQTMVAAKQQRRLDAMAAPTTQRPLLATWHRWRMGDSYFSSSVDDRSRSKSGTTTGAGGPDRTPAATEERMRREYQRNDEIWMASVGAITMAVILGFGLAGANQ